MTVTNDEFDEGLEAERPAISTESIIESTIMADKISEGTITADKITRKDLRTVEVNTEPYKPAVPAIVRTVIYVASLVICTLAMLAMGLAGILWSDYASEIVGISGVVTAVTGWVCSATGTAFNPVNALK